MSEYDQQNFNASVICWSSHLQTLRCVPVNDHMAGFPLCQQPSHADNKGKGIHLFHGEL